MEYIQENEIKNIIKKKLSLEEIHVLLYNNHYQIIAIDSIFYNMSVLEAHKMIYAPLTQYILNNKIHALSIKIFTPKDWSEQRKFFST